MAIRNKLIWVFFGAVIGNLSAGPTGKAVDLVHEWQCPGKQRLVEGKVLRRQAIEESDDTMHRVANEKLQASVSCGNPEASAQLGLAYCHGLGVKRDRLRGGQLIRFAYENGARLSPDWFLDPDFCPGRDS